MNLEYGNAVNVEITQNGNILLRKPNGEDIRIDKNSDGTFYVAMTGKEKCRIKDGE